MNISRYIILLGFGAALACFPLQAKADFVISTGAPPIELKVIRLINQEIFDRLGKKVTIQEGVPSERSLNQVNSGIADGDGLRIPGLEKEYPNLVMVPEPYMSVQFIGFSKNPATRLNGWESLMPFRIGYLTGWKVIEQNIKDIAFTFKPTPVTFEKQLFLMLDADRLDIAIHQRVDGLKIMKEMGLSGMHPLEEPLSVINLYLYVHKKHTDFIPQMVEVLKGMKADGAYDRLMKEVMGD